MNTRKNETLNNNSNEQKKRRFIMSNQKLSKEEFKESVVKALETYFGPDYKVTLNHVIKNNNQALTGLCILKAGNNVAPTIYLDEFYSSYLDGNKMGYIINQIVRIYEENERNIDFDVEYFFQFNNVKDRVVYKLVNYDKNQDFLADVPHVKYLDLAVVFYIIVSGNSKVSATITIKNSHLKLWNVDVDSLYELAKINTPRLLKADLKSMNEIMAEIIKENFLSNLGGNSDMLTDFDSFYDEMLSNNVQEPQMYVLTNTNKMQGAAAIIYDDILKNFAQSLNKDLYILPSSIHESILIPKTDSIDSDSIRNMVVEVNNSEVADNEILSDNIYLYDRLTNTISIIK